MRSIRDPERAVTTDPPRVSADLWRIAIALSTGSVLAGLDTSLVNVGLATIGAHLDAALATVQWVSSTYLLALATALPACGWLCRRFGVGRLWLTALISFTCASVLCAAAPDIAALITARVLQGVAGGLLIPAGMTVLGTSAGPQRLGRVIAISSVPAILAPAVGPVVGAALVASLSWRWLFLVNVPVAVVGLILGLRWVPRDRPGAAGRLDVPSLVLVVVGLPLVVFSVTEATAAGLAPVASWVPAIVGVGALALFVRRSRRQRRPLLDLRPAGNRVFRAAAAEVFFVGAALFGGLVVLPLYLQLQLGQGLIRTGLLLMAFSIGAAVTLPAAGVLTDRYGGGIVAVTGLLVTIASTLPMALLPAMPNLFVVEFLQFTRGCGLALSGSPGVAAALATVEHDQLPDATSEVNILSRVGGALGTAVFTMVLSAGMTVGAGPNSLVLAFHRTFWWLTGAAVAALAAAGWLTWEQRRNPVTRRPRIRWVPNDQNPAVGDPTKFEGAQ